MLKNSSSPLDGDILMKNKNERTPTPPHPHPHNCISRDRGFPQHDVKEGKDPQ